MSKPRITFDSCAIIHLLSGNSIWCPYLDPIYKDVEDGKYDIVLPEISVAECVRLESAGSKPMTPEQSEKIISAFFRNKFILRRGITSRESEFAATLIRKHKLGTCDALIAATAVFNDVETLYSADGCTGRRKDGKLLTVPIVQTDCGKRMNIVDPSHGAVAGMLAKK